MKISFYTVNSNLRTDNGYGYAGHNIRNSLTNIGHSMTFNDETAPIQLDFCQPNLYKFYKNQYRIGYTPWESSSLPEEWIPGLDSIDELWTTSEKCAEWYNDAGVKKPIHIYKHGIEPLWTPKLRKRDGVLKFLHIGEPAPRKGGQMALEAFQAAFGGNTDVHLTIKGQHHTTVRAYASHIHRGGPRSILGLPSDVYRNVTIITDNLSTDELVELYHNHDVLVYPSWGEGFGLIPLQALATGMPTICTEEWAPYKKYLGPLALQSKEQESPWQVMHPGKMYKPDINHLIDLYRYISGRYNALAESFYQSSFDVHKEYNWDTLTENAFRHLGDIK
jgi:glycosyltransferase involved in cell wall biosynthesis